MSPLDLIADMIEDGASLEEIRRFVAIVRRREDAVRNQVRRQTAERVRQHRERKKEAVKAETHVTRYAVSQEDPHTPKESLSSGEGITTHTRESPGSIELGCREAGDLLENRSPGLRDVSPILGLIDAGYDLEGEILPVIRARSGPHVTSWRYFTQAVHDSRANRVFAASVPPRREFRNIGPPRDQTPKRASVMVALERVLATCPS